MLHVVTRDKQDEPRFVCLICREFGQDERFYTISAFESHVAKCNDDKGEKFDKRFSYRAMAPGFYNDQESPTYDYQLWLEEKDSMGRSRREKILKGDKSIRW